ncbi:MAG TPA: hypothetical protein VE569_11700 [Acidimicrobiia bacterium]|nr:hypothetical protein [Acidimicrobiia bacterium]
MGFERGAFLGLWRRPDLLVEALRAWLAMLRRGGLSPSPDYLQWRTFTAYGDHFATASAHDLVNYLAWRRGMRSIRKWERET